MKLTQLLIVGPAKKSLELIFDWREGIFNVDIILTEPSLNVSLIEF